MTDNNTGDNFAAPFIYHPETGQISYSGMLISPNSIPTESYELLLSIVQGGLPDGTSEEDIDQLKDAINKIIMPGVSDQLDPVIQKIRAKGPTQASTKNTTVETVAPSETFNEATKSFALLWSYNPETDHIFFNDIAVSSLTPILRQMLITIIKSHPNPVNKLDMEEALYGTRSGQADVSLKNRFSALKSALQKVITSGSASVPVRDNRGVFRLSDYQNEFRPSSATRSKTVGLWSYDYDRDLIFYDGKHQDVTKNVFPVLRLLIDRFPYPVPIEDLQKITHPDIIEEEAKLPINKRRIYSSIERLNTNPSGTLPFSSIWYCEPIGSFVLNIPPSALSSADRSAMDMRDYESLSISHLQKRAWRGDKAIEHIRNEGFLVLAKLMEQAEAFVPTADLALRVYGNDSDTSIENIRSVIQNLKATLRSDGEWIRNHHFQGYMLCKDEDKFNEFVRKIQKESYERGKARVRANSLQKRGLHLY